MKSRRGQCSFLLIIILIGMLSLLHSPVSVNSQGSDNASNTPEEQIVSRIRGWEKLSPDLRDVIQNRLDEHPSQVLGLASRQRLVVNALIRPGIDIRRLFIRSAISRQFGEYQWVVGEIPIENLLKLTSHPGVFGIFSRETYQTTEAPELESLLSPPPTMSVEEGRFLLNKGGPNLLQQHLQQAALNAPERKSGASVQPPASLNADTIPSILDIHDVHDAYQDGFTGEGVVVAVVDTGVDFSHPDLQGVQAVISHGPYAGWPFSYDVVSGAEYAMNPQAVMGPDNFWSMIGYTQYVRTTPVTDAMCIHSICTASLIIGGDEETGTAIQATWPNESKSGNYFYTIHPDLRLMFAAYNLGINYPGGWVPPVVIVSDENDANVYDTVYVDINYNNILGDSGEKINKAQPLSGVDLTGDDTWDLSGGMLTWISDGENHPPGVSTLYPDMLENIDPPLPGQLLAFVSDQNGHGTNCASEIAGQGQITDPRGIGPSNPLYAGGADIGGVGTPVILGMAPGAKIAAFQNGFDLPLDAWTLAALGMDGVENSGDEVQIVSNSWGDSRTIEDGWDPTSRYAQYLSYEVAPSVSFLAATGNGGHGYGTQTAPGGASILDIGASTAYGALRGFERVTPEQFLFGEVQPWSNRGPGSLGDIAPDLVAVGAWGTGAQPLNYYYGDGQAAYDIFGGTSMSTPIAAGNLALVYQAFYEQDQNQRWPNWEEARAILLSSAQNLGYDVFIQGSGNLQAGRAVDIAAGRSPWVEPQQWLAGDYRGKQYPAFPSILHAGDMDHQEFTIQNPSEQDITVQINQGILRKQFEESFTLSFSPPRPVSQYNLPLFLEELTGMIEMYNPAFVQAQVSIPYTYFDVDDDISADTWWSVSLYDWTDLNQDGNLWVDTNRNRMVDLDEIDLDTNTGIYEYNRFTYGYPQSTTLEASLGSQGLAQKHDGIFLGLNCNYCGQSVTLQVQITFYEKVTWDWLSLNTTDLDVPSHGKASFSAELSIPQDVSPGTYNSTIQLETGSSSILIPVSVHVAATSQTFDFGGSNSQSTTYNNGSLIGGFNWNWRYESGDWRSFYFDLPDGTAQPGRSLLVDTHWDVPRTDLDTWVLSSSGTQEPLTDPNIVGPQGLTVVGGSEDTYLTNGKFSWKTNTGTSHELIGAPVTDGLNMLTLHNVLSGGGSLPEIFSGSVFQFSSQPGIASFYPEPESAQYPYLSASQPIIFTSTGNIPEGIQIHAYGFSTPTHLENQVVKQDRLINDCTASWIYRSDQGGLEIRLGGLLEITTTSNAPDLDLDVYLFEDNGDDIWNCSRDSLKAYSINSDAQEHIRILYPADGQYWIVVNGYSVPEMKQNFDIDIRAIQGTQIQLRNLPSGPIQANVPVSVQANFQSLYVSSQPSTLEGLMLVGPPSVPDLLEIPIYLRPNILIYPEPLLTSKQFWLQQTPQQFSLSFQNHGVETETTEVSINLPDGIVYLPGTAKGPDTNPIYNPSAHSLFWHGEVGDSETILITFLATAQPGLPPAQAVIDAYISGIISGQSWHVSHSIWLNLYGSFFPLIKR